MCASWEADGTDLLRHVRTRLYFTSESHIVSLFNILRLGEAPGGGSLITPEARRAMEEAVEFNYLSHVIVKMWEDPGLDFQDPGRFKARRARAPGTSCAPMLA